MSRERLVERVHQLGIEFAKERGIDEKLCGLCGILAFTLFEAMSVWDELYGTNYDPSLLIGVSDYNEGKRWIHCWVSSDNVIYDPSFSQFNTGIPYFIGVESPHHTFLSHNLREADSFDDFHTWEDGQMPTEETVEWFFSRLNLTYTSNSHIEELEQILKQFS